MKVLLWCNYNSFSLNLISRLKKEKCEIFVITGKKRASNNKPAGVLQEYHFEYNSESIYDVSSSVQPDIAVYLGPQDGNFTWENEMPELVKYTSGITNALISAKKAGVKKFIYLSNQDVFENINEYDLEENTEIKGSSIRSKAVIEGEKICSVYHEANEFDVIIARCAEIYGSFGKENIDNNICNELYNKVIISNKVNSNKVISNEAIIIDANREHNILRVEDAVEALYRLFMNKTDNEVYHISSGVTYTEKDILQAILIVLDKEVDSTEIIRDEANHCLINTNIAKLGFKAKYDLPTGIQRMCCEVKIKEPNEVDKTNQATKKKTKKTKKIVKAIIENLILFGVVQLLIMFTPDAKLHNVIDIYLLYVIVIAAIYGSFQATLSVILSVIGKFVLLMETESLLVLFTNFENYLWILQTFSIGMICGYSKDEHQRISYDLKDENEYLKNELDNIKSINRSNVEVKDLYERRLLNYKDSFAKIYDVVSKLDYLDKQKIMFEAVTVVSQIMSSKDVCIYTVDPKSKYFRLIAASSPGAKLMGKSVQLRDYKAIYQRLEKQEIYVNHKMSLEYPLLAGATYINGEIATVIMIWSMDFENNNLYQMNLFSVVCKLIDKAMGNAYQYMESTRNSEYIENTRVMKTESFIELLDLYCYGEAKKLLDFTLLKVKSLYENENGFRNDLNQLVRNTDFIGKGKNNEYYILLTNSDMEDAQYVIDRLDSAKILVEIEQKKKGNTIGEVFCNFDREIQI